MKDTELLELAAKAANLPVEFDCKVNGWFANGRDDEGDVLSWWNPLTDDGDALRLAVMLELDIEFDYKPDGPQTYATVVGHEVENRTSYEHHGNNKDLATRRAIVRAAAEIGKAK